jgi:hypothetical protein
VQGEESAKFSLQAALNMQQLPPFSLKDSHTFNRLQHANNQDWQRDSTLRWNKRKKIATISLDLPRLHTPFIFVLCASIPIEGTRFVGLETLTS